MSAKILALNELKPKVNLPKGMTPPKKELSAAELKKREAAQEAMEREQAILDKMVSRFERSLKRQKKKLKKKNQTITDSAGNIAILKAMLSMTTTILPIAEKQYKRYKNDRAVASVVMLVKQAREISTDIQRLGGAASASPVIINTIISPNFQHLLQNSLNEGATLSKKLKLEVPKANYKAVVEHINTFLRNQTQYMGQINLAMSEQVEKYFDEK